MTGDFQYQEPRSYEITNAQRNWIKGYLDEFETVLQGPSFNDPCNGYAKYIDVESFIEHDIIVELFKNPDGHKLSTYMYKDRGGKLTMGPVFDYNFGSGNTTNPGWSYPDWFSKSDAWYSKTAPAYGWYRRMLEDPDYKVRYADKWFEHREDKLSDAQVNADINYYYNLLRWEGMVRNFSRWDILNTWVECNYYYGTTGDPHNYQMEVEWFRNWFTGGGILSDPCAYDPVYSDRLG